jgi:hypothetical protein
LAVAQLEYWEMEAGRQGSCALGALALAEPWTKSGVLAPSFIGTYSGASRRQAANVSRPMAVAMMTARFISRSPVVSFLAALMELTRVSGNA